MSLQPYQSFSRKFLTSNRVPPNVQFEVDDIEEEWTFSEPFDLVHIRFMACSIADWPKLVNQAFAFVLSSLSTPILQTSNHGDSHTKPGGWCEFKDFDLDIISSDGSLPADSYLMKYHSLVFEALDKIGRDHAPGPKLKDWVASAGYKNIHEDVLAIPIGVWPKEKKYVSFSSSPFISFPSRSFPIRF